MKKSASAARELFVCERCNGTKDVGITYINDLPKTYCEACREELFKKKKPVGRPSLGITRKVSLTLEEDEWEKFDHIANGNSAKFLRELVRENLKLYQST